MPGPLSVDLRNRVVKAYLAGGVTYEKVAARFTVGAATVNRWVNQFRRTGAVEPKAMGTGPGHRIVGRYLELLQVLVEEQPDATRAELTWQFVERSGLVASEATVGRAMQRLGLTRKKKRFMRRNGTRSGSSN